MLKNQYLRRRKKHRPSLEKGVPDLAYETEEAPHHPHVDQELDGDDGLAITPGLLYITDDSSSVRSVLTTGLEDDFDMRGRVLRRAFELLPEPEPAITSSSQQSNTILPSGILYDSPRSFSFPYELPEPSSQPSNTILSSGIIFDSPRSLQYAQLTTNSSLEDEEIQDESHSEDGESDEVERELREVEALLDRQVEQLPLLRQSAASQWICHIRDEVRQVRLSSDAGFAIPNIKTLYEHRHIIQFLVGMTAETAFNKLIFLLNEEAVDDISLQLLDVCTAHLIEEMQ